MSSFPPTALTAIDSAIQQGRGAAAAVLGQPYLVYRLSSSTQGSIVSGTPVFTGFPARIRRTTEKQAIENVIFELMCFEAMCDARNLNVGDALVETGFGSTNSPYLVAQKRPTRETLLIRCETSCAIMHPTPEAGSVSQQPSTNTNQYVAYKYGGNQPATAQNVVLVNGAYALDPSFHISPAAIPCGFEPLNRIRVSGNLKMLPSEYAETFFCVYVPDTPGYQLVENDELKAPNQDTYIARQVFNANGVGIAGNICIAQRKAT